jgi:hypothetical protein
VAETRRVVSVYYRLHHSSVSVSSVGTPSPDSAVAGRRKGQGGDYLRIPLVFPRSYVARCRAAGPAPESNPRSRGSSHVGGPARVGSSAEGARLVVFWGEQCNWGGGAAALRAERAGGRGMNQTHACRRIHTIKPTVRTVTVERGRVACLRLRAKDNPPVSDHSTPGQK